MFPEDFFHGSLNQPRGVRCLDDGCNILAKVSSDIGRLGLFRYKVSRARRIRFMPSFKSDRGQPKFKRT